MNTTAPRRTDSDADSYRWNQLTAAQNYDAAAPAIHPYYTSVQDQILASIPFKPDDIFHVVDLGGGSGRLAERLLNRFPNARFTIVDPSGAFVRLAATRLEKATQKAGQVHFVQATAQKQEWTIEVPEADVIVSTSALHHLDGHEKRSAFQLCQKALRPGGLFINGDEYRPASDEAYYGMLETWGQHMAQELALGNIPAGFEETIIGWRERNLHQFGQPRSSGDDCHETVEEQCAKLYGAGFKQVNVVWHEQLWAVLKASC